MTYVTRNTAPSRSKVSSHASFTADLVAKYGNGVETAALHTSADDRVEKARAKIATAAGMPLDLVPSNLDPAMMGPKVRAAAIRLGYVSETIQPDADEDAAIADAVTAVREARRQRGWSA